MSLKPTEEQYELIGEAIDGSAQVEQVGAVWALVRDMVLEEAAKALDADLVGPDGSEYFSDLVRGLKGNP